MSFGDYLSILRKTSFPKGKKKTVVSTPSGKGQGRERAERAQENSTAPLSATGPFIIYIFNMG